MKRILLLFLAVTGLIFSLSSYAANHYTLLLEAGSSGSRVHLFQYDAALSIPEIKGLFSKEMKPGLSSFVHQPEAAGNSLKPLLDGALEVLSKLSVDSKTVDIHVLASAGMRLLSESQQNQIYASLHQYLTKHYPFRIRTIKTITGKEEGLYGWLTVNYLKGTFQRKEPSIGSIDMGGASTQIAYATPNTNPSTDKVTVVIDQQLYSVFSKSFLNLGQDRAREAMLTAPDAASCYPAKHPIDQVRLGAFDKQRCRQIYSQILQKNAVKQQVAPPPGMTFVAYSGVYYAYDFFKVTPPESFLQRIGTVCSKAWEVLEKEHPGNRYLSNYCANGVYIHELLHEHYQLQPAQLVVTNNVNQQSIDWTLGALLYQIIQHQIYWEQPPIIHEVTSAAAKISWHPAFSGSPIVYDLVVKGSGQKQKVYRNIAGHSASIQGLQHDTIHSVVVIAKNPGGQITSSPVPFRTKNHKPVDLIPDWCIAGC